MVVLCDDKYFERNPKTLGDWVKNFRLKKMQMKRKLRSGGELRVCAILSTALKMAELELQQKQRERFQKWSDFQTKINKNNELQPRKEFVPSRHKYQQQSGEMILVSDHEEEEATRKQSEAIDNLWKCELSDLDNFMRSISSQSNTVVQELSYKPPLQTPS